MFQQVEAVGEDLRPGLAFHLWRGLELGAAFGDDEREAGDELGLVVDGEVEALREELLQEGTHLLQRELLVAFDFGGDVVQLRVHPAGHGGDVVLRVDGVGDLDEEGERSVVEGEEVGGEGAHGELADAALQVSCGVGVDEVDGGGFEGGGLGGCEAGGEGEEQWRGDPSDWLVHLPISLAAD
jgi:hypothetical protein